MKIAVFGAHGTIGRRITREALSRGHQVTAVARDPSRATDLDGVTVVRGDAQDAATVAAAVRGHDAVVNATGPAHDAPDPATYTRAARGLIEGLKQAGVKRLVVVGAAGSLEVAPGVQLVDTPGFPAAWRGISLGARDALEVYRAQTDGLEWTYLSPAALIAPGERTGRYRAGGDQLLVDEAGKSHISAEDYAVALLDELENPKNLRRRMTVAY